MDQKQRRFTPETLSKIKSRKHNALSQLAQLLGRVASRETDLPLNQALPDAEKNPPEMRNKEKDERRYFDSR